MTAAQCEGMVEVQAVRYEQTLPIILRSSVLIATVTAAFDVTFGTFSVPTGVYK